jgi:hypothetical protein
MDHVAAEAGFDQAFECALGVLPIVEGCDDCVHDGTSGEEVFEKEGRHQRATRSSGSLAASAGRAVSTADQVCVRGSSRSTTICSWRKVTCCGSRRVCVSRRTRISSTSTSRFSTTSRSRDRDDHHVAFVADADRPVEGPADRDTLDRHPLVAQRSRRP